MKFLRLFIYILVVLFSMTAIANESSVKEGKLSKSTQDVKVDLENTLYLNLKDGRVVIELMPSVAPKHVARIKELVKEGFYNGVVFHRVIDGFMAQTGDPTGTGMGGSKKPNLEAEFSSIPHDKGVVSMARASDPNSANSQFFIVLDEAHFLDSKYTVWGKVVEGMEYVEKIKKGDARKNGSVENPDKIISIQVASDAKSN